MTEVGISRGERERTYEGQAAATRWLREADEAMGSSFTGPDRDGERPVQLERFHAAPKGVTL